MKGKAMSMVMALIVILSASTVSSGCKYVPTKEDLEKREDWTVIFEDEYATPSYLEASLEEVHEVYVIPENYTTFEYEYSEVPKQLFNGQVEVAARALYPTVRLRYKDGKEYFNVVHQTSETYSTEAGCWVNDSPYTAGDYLINYQVQVPKTNESGYYATRIFVDIRVIVHE